MVDGIKIVDGTKAKGYFSPFDDKQYCALKRAYKKAVEDGEEHFTFEGSQLLVTYIKYLLEYVEDIRKRNNLLIEEIK